MTRHTLTAVVALGLVGAACGGAGEEVAPPTPTGSIADATEAPTPTPMPTLTNVPVPTEAAPTPTPTTAAPAATPTPDLSRDEDAVIAAWERYLDLSTQASGKNPSPEALDVSSYMTGEGAVEFASIIATDRESGTYVSGDAVSIRPIVEFRGAGAHISDCVRTDLELRALRDDTVLTVQDEGRVGEARAELVDAEWRIAAFETGASCEF